MASDDIDVAYVAKLARIALSPDETERFGTQLTALLEHVAALEKLAVADVPATAQVVPSENVVRDDVPRPSLERETVLEAAPERQGAYFRVPRIIAEDSIVGEET
ncbi:MAG: Asp-tRNA(Asn)/Glu-tRNA(Gln) amidotransferase subunit GatC [Candidatus Eremiobacteraeota bacterium]|nr:Asp-tRNA(Asn)/Glu-tRNA(Gln) amidotransferase subunit GatC [Candidatus Eremiobacteraeota bacterium]MBC5802054.1 Asp-tRNA(Asn)/Glu-tRNA(Gln) amidotransferase subunit GatC [Candidatus Eremiobacteraeota bacterium]MBC5822709.1 Asp-tRNA(Asn)/Glu-tRNA(Gln) amidotransferase subunit GatC [Candidatus Eremiobacteraeota bacterium]